MELISLRTNSTSYKQGSRDPDYISAFARRFADLYRSLALKDPDILSIHISSGLSGTANAARIGASMVPEANVDICDTKTLSAAQDGMSR